MKCELVALYTFYQIAVQCWILQHAYRVQNQSSSAYNKALFIMQRAIVTQYTIYGQIAHCDVNYAILSQVNLPRTVYTEQTRHQTPSARRPSTDATTFAAPLAKSRGAQFQNRWTLAFTFHVDFTFKFNIFFLECQGF